MFSKFSKGGTALFTGERPDGMEPFPVTIAGVVTRFSLRHGFRRLYGATDSGGTETRYVPGRQLERL